MKTRTLRHNEVVVGSNVAAPIKYRLKTHPLREEKTKSSTPQVGSVKNANIRDFRKDFSSSAFRKINGDLEIFGKFGRIIQLDDGTFDAWFVGPRPKLLPLSGQRMAVIRKNIPEEWGLRELTGEAWVQGRGRDFVLHVARLLGVKKKRRAIPGKSLHFLKKART
jgi:hypothetical protein